jgi:phosphofructokinase-like protein
MKKLLLVTGGGDCPGLNAVIRSIVKSAENTRAWEVYGSLEAFEGILSEPAKLIHLTNEKVAGLHVKGGTILQTSNTKNPLNYPVRENNGVWEYEDITGKLAERIKGLGFDAVINIGGDGSQRISEALYLKGISIVGVPKTIDNDLNASDYTFGFQSAVQTATESLDKLVSTAESHHRVMIMEVMGRDAGWIALHSAIAGGAEVCLIPEIPYSVEKIVDRIQRRYELGKGFATIVIAEGAKAKEGKITSTIGTLHSEHVRLGGVAFALSNQLKEQGCTAEIRETVLGHVQRGGIPIPFDRFLATLFGAKAFEMVENLEFGKMVVLKGNQFESTHLSEVTKFAKKIDPTCFEVKAAKSIGISFGD